MRWRVLLPLLFLLPMPPLRAAVRVSHPPPASVDDEPDPTSPDEVFSQMRHSFRADRARGQHTRYQFNFWDPQGGKWWIEIDDGAYKMGKGVIAHPDVTFSCAGADWVRLSVGTLNGFTAVLTGRLHITGNQILAHKLDDLFP
jgi:putative sterol carrier protein